MSRWMVLVQEYCPHIRHIPGKTNILADVLSRDCDVKVVSEGQAEDEVLVKQIHLVMSRDPNTNLWTGTPWQDRSLAFEQQRDPFIAPIVDSLDKQCDKTEDEVNISAYFMDEEILYKFITVTRLRVQQKLSVCCVPKIYLEASCRMIHQFTNHAAFDRCLIQAQKLIYHPDLKSMFKVSNQSVTELHSGQGKIGQHTAIPCTDSESAFWGHTHRLHGTSSCTHSVK